MLANNFLNFLEKTMNNNYVYFSAVKCFWSSINETIVTGGRFKGGGHTPPPTPFVAKKYCTFSIDEKSSGIKQKTGVQVSGTTVQLSVVSHNTHFDFSCVKIMVCGWTPYSQWN